MGAFSHWDNASPQPSANDHKSEMNSTVKAESPNSTSALIEMAAPRTTVEDVARITETQTTRVKALHFEQPAEVTTTTQGPNSTGIERPAPTTNFSNVANVIGVDGSQTPLENIIRFNPINQPANNNSTGNGNQGETGIQIIGQEIKIAEQNTSNTTTSSSTPQATQNQVIGNQALVFPGNTVPPRGNKERKHRRADPQDPSKHAPVCGRNIRFKWEDNRHIDESPFKVGQLEYKKVSFKLVDTNGKKHKFAYVRRQTMDWNKKEDIARADKWRKQIFNRRLNKGDGEKHLRDRRPHWSEREKDSIATLVKERISTTGQRLNTHDWTVIASEHNKKFAGTQVRIGEKLPISTTPKGGLTKGGIVKVAHTITTRTAGAIYSQAQRWPDVKETMENVLDEAEAGDKTDEDTEDTMDIDDGNNTKNADTIANSDAGYDSYGDEVEDEETNPHNVRPTLSGPQPMCFDLPTKVQHSINFQQFAPRPHKSPYGQRVDGVEGCQPFNTFLVANPIPFVASSSPSTNSQVALPKAPTPLPNDNSFNNVKIAGDKQATGSAKKNDESFIWGC